MEANSTSKVYKIGCFTQLSEYKKTRNMCAGLEAMDLPLHQYIPWSLRVSQGQAKRIHSPTDSLTLTDRRIGDPTPPNSLVLLSPPL